MAELLRIETEKGSKDLSNGTFTIFAEDGSILLQITSLTEFAEFLRRAVRRELQNA